MGNPHVHHAGSLEVSDNQGFAKLMPGFEFLQNLTRSAGSSLPNIGHWVTPTLDPAEIEKRIEELRTVKFWLEQNGKMLDTTIQALEVQRMTLTTLRNMNVQMSDLREAMMVPKPEEPAPSAAPAPAATASDAAVAAMAAAGQAAAAFAKAFQFPKPDAAPEASEAPARRRGPARAAQPGAEAVQDDPPISSAGAPGASDPAAEPPIQAAADAGQRHPSGPASAPPESTPAASSAGPVDPMQWWSTLTRQFTDIASAALQDAGTAGMATMNTAAADHAPARTAGPAARNKAGGAASSTKAAPSNPTTPRTRQGAPRAARSAATRSTSSAGAHDDPASAHDAAHAPLPRKEAIRKPPRR